MALLFIDGFDAGDTGYKWLNGFNASSSTSTRFGVGRSAIISNGSFYRDFTPSNQVFLGLSWSISNIDTVVRPYLALYGDAGATTHLSLGMSNSALILYRGILGTTIGTFNGTFIPNTWYSIEISATIADAGGTCTVKLNGATVISFTGDTKNGGTNTTFDRVALGSNGGYGASFDDVYMCNSTGSAPYNTFLGDVRVTTITPNGAGSDSGFSASSGANYTTVDELPFSATDYVTGSTVGTRDLYTMSDITGSYSVLAVQNNVIAKKTDAGAANLKLALKVGGTVHYSTPASLGSSDQLLTDIRTQNPTTSTSWTVSDVNALESGMEIA